MRLNDTTIPATYELAEKGRGHCPRRAPLDADLTDWCCERGPAARMDTAVC